MFIFHVYISCTITSISVISSRQIGHDFFQFALELCQSEIHSNGRCVGIQVGSVVVLRYFFQTNCTNWIIIKFAFSNLSFPNLSVATKVLLYLKLYLRLNHDQNNLRMNQILCGKMMYNDAYHNKHHEYKDNILIELDI